MLSLANKEKDEQQSLYKKKMILAFAGILTEMWNALEISSWNVSAMKVSFSQPLVI